jgi:hypothetical protein
MVPISVDAVSVTHGSQNCPRASNGIFSSETQIICNRQPHGTRLITRYQREPRGGQRRRTTLGLPGYRHHGQDVSHLQVSRFQDTWAMLVSTTASPDQLHIIRNSHHQEFTTFLKS